MKDSYDFFGKCGVILFIIVCYTGPESHSMIFRLVTMFMLLLWFVPNFIPIKDASTRVDE